MERVNQIPKNFNPQEREAEIYQTWMEQGLFRARVNPEKRPYTIVMPPPNITGQLHMGHALDNSLQDLIIRQKRMQGYEALWQPGTDHAAIATEARIVATMKEEGLSKEELGREAFLERAWAWKEQYGGRIVEQLKCLGASCDWERERFTMDEGLSEAVKEVFVRLYEKGLIYRGKKMINWCPHCHTTISDAEVEYEEQASHLWHIRYPYAEGEGYLVVATTRPETMLGDTAVAVHPEDERYAELQGKKLILPLLNKEIPVVADDYVERDFGTGVVKITPAHDPNDYELGLRHGLEIIEVIDDCGYMNEAAGPYRGLSSQEARKKIVADLEAGGYIEKIEDYTHSVGTCYRCGTTLDPKLSTQWFVRMEELARPAIEAVRKGEVRFVPERFSKNYFGWMENIRDWCISRQLWWGHRIPAWYCSHCGTVHVALEAPERCSHCASESLLQDEDTLDTWFSSALWPFSTLGWPEKTADLDYFFPTDTLVTGPDIIFFWVARMIFSALEQMGEVPFKTVYFHGIVRDSQGRKMSKSLNNGIDPLEVIARYGADALRHALVDGNAPGSDQRYREEKVKAAAAFMNKVWNAFRFVMQNLDEDYQHPASLADLPELRLEDRWMLSRLSRLIEEVSQNLERFEFGIALAKLHSCIWEEYCDWYIEMQKPRLRSAEPELRHQAQALLLQVLTELITLLHPFMPFFTEEIYQYLPQTRGSIMLASWPLAEKYPQDSGAEEQMQMVMELLRKLRSTRLQYSVPPKKRLPLYLRTEDGQLAELFSQTRDYLERLAGISDLEILTGETAPDRAVACPIPGATAYLPLEELIDIEAERQNLEKELEQCRSYIQRQEQKLANSSFVQRAPAQVVQAERDKLEEQQQLLTQLSERLASLG